MRARQDVGEGGGSIALRELWQGERELEAGAGSMRLRVADLAPSVLARDGTGQLQWVNDHIEALPISRALEARTEQVEG